MKGARVSAGLLAAAIPAALLAAPSAKETTELRRITAKYATCVVHKHHAKASEALLSAASNREIIGPMSQIIDSDCLTAIAGNNSQMRFPNDTYQYALADALVNADFRIKGPASFADRLPLAQPAQPSEQAQATALANAKNEKQRRAIKDGYTHDMARAWLSRFGECTVRQDPEAARYWILTSPDTPEEASRIKAMQPALNGCMGDGTIRFSRITLRGNIAVNYYRLAMATIVPTSGSPS